MSPPRKPLLLVGALASTLLLLPACDLPIDFIPGGGLGGAGGVCEPPEAVAAAWVEPFDQQEFVASDASSEENEPQRYVVHLTDEEDGAAGGYAGLATGITHPKLEARARAVERVGGRVLRRFEGMGAVAAELTPAQADALSVQPEVAAVERDARRYLFAQSQKIPYGVAQTGAPEAWSAAVAQRGSVAKGAKTCIIDSGLYAPHEDLPRSGVSGYPSGWNTDSCGHGTHVAGTVGALDNATGVVGLSPAGADLFVVKVFGDDCGWSYASELADAVKRCADAGAKVVNLSLGGNQPSELERDAFENAWGRGLLLVAAAGNEGTTDLQYPASYPSVLSVGAVDGMKRVASFSQRNGQVDLTAPGVKIESTVGRVSRHEVSLPSKVLQGGPIEHAPATSGASGLLINGGRCESPGSWTGRVVACERGGNTFAQKLDAVSRGGGVAAVLYNSAPGPFQGTLGDARVSLPAVAVPGEDKAALLAAVGARVTVVNEPPKPGSGYAAFSGTSMASPHVAGAASLIWGQHPERRNADVRRSLLETAQEAGTLGRDDAYGHGQLRADEALRHLGTSGSGSSAPEPGYFASCTGLECTLYDASFDADGDLRERAFLVEGRRLPVDAKRRAKHTFGGPGPHRVSVEATDSTGATATWTRALDVVQLQAQGSTVDGGARTVALRWNGIGGDRVAIVRDGKVVGSTKNSGEATERFSTAPNSALRYRVCDTSLSSCSNEVTIAPVCGT